MKFNNRFCVIRLTLVLTALVACFNLSSANETAAWQTDYKQALAQAAKEHKQVLLDFTGSDWCPFCIQMDREVLEKPEFMKYADQNLILVKLDFPRKKHLPTEEIAQNRALQKQYSIDGYPTYVLLNSAGKEINRQEGSLDGGPSAFIGWARAKK
jgi:protein disulfide-isomerase